MFEAKILGDAISPAGWRITSFQITCPRIVLPELLTHRALSRNTASSRAIPVKKRIQSVRDLPFVPASFGRNQRGMSAKIDLDAIAAETAEQIWREAAASACRYANSLAELEVHKQLANRLIEPFAWVTLILTATHWRNFYNRRVAPDAQPEFQRIAGMMLELHRASTPYEAPFGWWHLPLVSEAELPLDQRVHPDTYPETGPIDWIKVSAGRCARVSYETQDKPRSPYEDMALADELVANGHMSPLEHPAWAMDKGHPGPRGNLWGWEQFRQSVTDEAALPQPGGVHLWDDGPWR